MPEILTGNSEVPRIKVGEDFQAGPFTFQDLYKILIKEIKGSALFKSIDLEKFLFQLKRGDDNAVIIAGVIAILTTFIICYLISRLFEASEKPAPVKEDLEEEKEPLRDFTISQLRDFDGTKDQPIYVGLKGEVFDVSSASDLYGPGKSYSCFAGREASRAMARLSFEEEDLSSTKLEDLGPFERNTLDDWYQKFKLYKCYPIVGRVSAPPSPKAFTFAELSEYVGKGSVQTGRVDAPIYMAINGKVLDVSYGGKGMYSEGGPYHLFAGRDASRALAKMSFNPECLNNSDVSDLTEQEKKTLSDWEKKFVETRKYPIVGTLVHSEKTV